MLSASRKGPAFKPQLRVCYLCGQQFGSASIGIHIPQCYGKKVAQWEVADPATRGRRPKHPDTVNWQGEGMSTDKLNDEQFHEFTANLVPCDRCGRRFLPDRLVVHLRSCKGDNGRSSSRGAGSHGDKSLGGSNQTSTTPKGSQFSRKRSESSFSRTTAHRPQLPICYLCGQQFGTTSIEIHVPQCYAKKLAQWKAADVNARGKPPKHPDTVNWKTNTASLEEHNDAQFEEFMNNLEPCPNCGRRFFAERLIIHLRSCKPGASAKPVPKKTPSLPPEPRGSYVRPSTEGANSHTPKLAGRSVSALKSDAKDEDDSLRSVRNINPKVRRLPKNDNSRWVGVACPSCGTIEYNASAKFCGDCGTSLVSKSLSEPCATCGEKIPEGSRFCGTCGFPVNGAAAVERKEGVESANVPSIRVVVCPACKTICNADGNFCDNCGAALGSTELLHLPTATKDAMYCKTCRESVFDLSAKFCEDCGGPLEKITVNALGPHTEKRLSALPPVSNAKGVEPSTVASSLSPAGSGKSSVSNAKLLSRSKVYEKRGNGKERPNSCASQDSARSVTNDAVAGQGPVSLPSPFKKNISRNAPAVFVDDGVEAVDIGERLPCSFCGRKFAQDALDRHERVCVKQKPRKQFNMQAVRIAGTGAEKVVMSSSGTRRAAEGTSKRNWRAESEAFRRSLREARMVDKVLKSGGDLRNLPPPTYSENSHYTPCPHCGRKFAPDVAERHIPRCATTVNKPKPPPRRR